MVLSSWQVECIERHVARSCNPRGPVYADLVDHMCCMVEESMDDGMEFDEALADAAGLLPGTEIEQTEQITLELLSMDTTCKPHVAVWALLPWALICFAFYFRIGMDTIPRPVMLIYRLVGHFIPVFAIIAYGVIGWKRNFPRWTFPVIGLALGMAVMSCISILHWQNWHQGNTYILTFILAFVALAIILNPSLEPFREIGRKVKRDPWLALFAFYPVLCFITFRLQDGIEAPIFKQGIVAAVVVAIFSWGFYAFLTNENKQKRGLTLVASLVLIAAVSWATAKFWF